MCAVILVKNHNSCTNGGSTLPPRETLVRVRLTKVAVKLPLWVGNYTAAAVHFPTAALHNSWQRRRYRYQQVGTAANQPLSFSRSSSSSNGSRAVR